MAGLCLTVASDNLTVEHLRAPFLNLLIITEKLNSLQKCVGVEEKSSNLQHSYHIVENPLEILLLLQYPEAVCEPFCILPGCLEFIVIEFVPGEYQIFLSELLI